MNIVIEYNRKEVAKIQIGHVWDREDKYLVIIDNEKKIKYVPNTYSSNFSSESIRNLIYRYASTILNINSEEVSICYKGTFNVNRICHNDDFMNHYKKNYQYFGVNKCSQIGLKY